MHLSSYGRHTTNATEDSLNERSHATDSPQPRERAAHRQDPDRLSRRWWKALYPRQDHRRQTPLPIDRHRPRQEGVLDEDRPRAGEVED